MTQCRNNLRNLGLACHNFHDAHGFYPRNTVRPRGHDPGQRPAGGQPEQLEQRHVRVVAPRDHPLHRADRTPGSRTRSASSAAPPTPAARHYKVPAYGFTWYVGVYSNPACAEQRDHRGRLEAEGPVHGVTPDAVTDGTSNTIMIAERPPAGATASGGGGIPRAASRTASRRSRGDTKIYSSGGKGKCPDPAVYRRGDFEDNCAFNARLVVPRGGGPLLHGGRQRPRHLLPGGQPRRGRESDRGAGDAGGGTRSSRSISARLRDARNGKGLNPFRGGPRFGRALDLHAQDQRPRSDTWKSSNVEPAEPLKPAEPAASSRWRNRRGRC